MLKYKLGFGLLMALTVGCVVWMLLIVAGARPEGGRLPERGHQQASESSESARADDPASTIPVHAELARVVDQVDGDTLKIKAVDDSRYLMRGQQTTVRLLEIDTPESVDPNSPVQCYATEASEALSSLAPVGTDVWVKADTELLDPYGRTLLYLWTSDGTFINRELVLRGYAKAVLFEPNDEYIGSMRRAEATARGGRRGLWGACDSFGQIKGFAQPSTSSTPKTQRRNRTDPRFPYCYEANEAGYGNYRAGRDREYGWYQDADQDGVVCEF